jgi:hypothetical protein
MKMGTFLLVSTRKTHQFSTPSPLGKKSRKLIKISNFPSQQLEDYSNSKGFRLKNKETANRKILRSAKRINDSIIHVKVFFFERIHGIFIEDFLIDFFI